MDITSRLNMVKSVVLSIILLICVGAGCDFRSSTFHFERFQSSEEVKIDDEWSLTMQQMGDLRRSEKYFYTSYFLINRNGLRNEITRIPLNDLEFTKLRYGSKKFLLIRYYSTGSSEAYIYQLFALESDTMEEVAVKEYFGHETQDCSGDMVKIISSQFRETFFDCDEPELKDGQLIFDMPGNSCKIMSASGGCPSRTVVPLK